MRKSLYLAAGVSVALVALSATLPADANGARHSRAPAAKGIAPTYPVVADGLNNPRQLNFSKSGKLYVTEAGTGGTDDCTIGGEGEEVCWGPSGSVTVVANGHQRRVVKGLPSYANSAATTTPGGSALGPADVVPYGKGKLAISLGFGLDPALRDGLAKPGGQFGKVLKYDLGSKSRGTLGDLAAFEGKHNPIHDPNTDPTGLFKWGRSWYATDSGGNDLVKIRKGKVSLVKAFRDEPVTGGKAQAVPTDVAVGPDGALYVSELTGFPFEKGAAKIYRIKPGHKPTVYANHLTNVTSIAFGKDGKLYAVQIANDGLASMSSVTDGSLWRVASKKSGKKHKNISGPLFAPYGVAIKGHRAFVSIGAVAPGGGAVIRIPLAR
jgi:hypothetical protein